MNQGGRMPSFPELRNERAALFKMEEARRHFTATMEKYEAKVRHGQREKARRAAQEKSSNPALKKLPERLPNDPGCNSGSSRSSSGGEVVVWADLGQGEKVQKSPHPTQEKPLDRSAIAVHDQGCGSGSSRSSSGREAVVVWADQKSIPEDDRGMCIPYARHLPILRSNEMNVNSESSEGESRLTSFYGESEVRPVEPCPCNPTPREFVFPHPNSLEVGGGVNLAHLISSDQLPFIPNLRHKPVSGSNETDLRRAYMESLEGESLKKPASATREKLGFPYRNSKHDACNELMNNAKEVPSSLEGIDITSLTINDQAIPSSLHRNLKSVDVNALASAFKIRIKAVDMAAPLQEHAFRCARSTLESVVKVNFKFVASSLKKEFDKAYGPAWHCIVGTSFGSYVTYSLGGFVYFSMEKVSVLLFKTAVEPLHH